jgi:hypothetical protein
MFRLKAEVVRELRIAFKMSRGLKTWDEWMQRSFLLNIVASGRLSSFVLCVTSRAEEPHRVTCNNDFNLIPSYLHVLNHPFAHSRFQKSLKPIMVLCCSTTPRSPVPPLRQNLLHPNCWNLHGSLHDLPIILLGSVHGSEEQEPRGPESHGGQRCTVTFRRRPLGWIWLPRGQ